jgi:hypothetical protein
MKREIAARMALTAVILGTVTAIMGTGRVTLSLVLSGAVMWSFVPVLQLLTGVLFITGRNASAVRAYFATGRFWLLWMLAIGTVLLMKPDPGFAIAWMVATLVVPAALTIRALGRLVPWRRVLLHQLVTFAILVSYVAWAIGGWVRLLDEVVRR